MRATGLIALLVVTAAWLAGCGGIVDAVTDGGKLTAATGGLWPDVPPFASAQQVAVDLPLPVKLMVQAYVKSASNGDADLSYLAYTTPAEPAAVAAFYTAQRMTAAGWNLPNTPDCAQQIAGATSNGTLCFFGRREGNRETILMIVVTRDAGSGPTHIFYLRGSATETGSARTRGPALLAAAAR
jgi:hypothetical protein